MANEGTTKRGISKGPFFIVLLIVVLGLLAAGGYLFMKNRDLKQKNNSLQTQNTELTKQLGAYKTDPNQAAQAEADKVIGEVGKLYALPKDEKPSVATVKDKAKLTDQPFFKNAENGDITLIYSTAKLAILYRPSSKQIINVSSVTIQDQPAATTPAP